MKRKRRWKLLWHLAHRFLTRRFRLEAEPCTLDGPCLVVSNHVTTWDPLLLSMSFPDKPIRFVASEHIFRHGLVSRLLNWLVAPIPRKKAASGADTVMASLRALKAGDSVCIFAEGDASWDGLTHPVFPATGKLARMAGVPLVTYRLEGGYLSLPRWSKKLRRGKMRGVIVGVYPPETLKAMKGPEITALIDRDLFEDAWARQRQEHIPYRGKDRAEGIERGFFLCPKCGGLGTARGAGDRVRCACGLDLLYTEEGFFNPPDPVETPADWEKMQRAALPAFLERAEDVVFSEENAVLREIGGAHRESELGRGTLALSREKLSCAGRDFPLAEIDSMAMVKANILLFSAGDRYFEIRAEGRPCLRKYLLAWEQLTR